MQVHDVHAAAAAGDLVEVPEDGLAEQDVHPGVQDLVPRGHAQGEQQRLTRVLRAAFPEPNPGHGHLTKGKSLELCIKKHTFKHTFKLPENRGF